MKTERARMIAGELYDPSDPELVKARERARSLCRALNSADSDHSLRRQILTQLFGKGGDTVCVRQRNFDPLGR
jgi:maltose O-acetyltransferase